MENTGTSEDSGQRSGNNKPLSEYSDSDVLSEITNANKGKRSVLEKFGIIILSLAIFAGTGLFRSTLTELVILIIVLFVHEAGHLLAMKLLKYSDVNLLFLPFIGAVTSGREQTPYASRKALVSIAGPLPGLLIGLFFVIVYAMTHQQLCFDIAVMFLFLNAFNLLPFYPLDGGSFFDLVLFSRHYVIELAFKVITSLLLIALVLFLEAWALLLIPFFVLVSLKTSYYVHKAAKRVKTDLPYQTIETLTLTEELVGKIRARIDEKAFGNRKTLKNLASLVDATWEKVFNIPPRLFKTLSLLFLYVASLGFIGAAFIGLAVLPDKGSVYLEKGEYDQAISEFSKTLETDPNNARALFGRGTAYQLKGVPDQADSDFKKAFEITSNDSRAYTRRGTAYTMKKEYDKAISDFNTALQTNPRDGLAYSNRARAYYLKKEYDKSWEDMNKAKELGFDIPADFLDDLRKASGREN